MATPKASSGKKRGAAAAKKGGNRSAKAGLIFPVGRIGSRLGLTREAAYHLVQTAAMKTWEVKHAGRDDADFLAVLKADPEVAKHFPAGELEALCSLDFHFKEVDSRFKKLGL